MLIFEPVKPGKNIRWAGEDIAAGDRVLGPGQARPSGNRAAG